MSRSLPQPTRATLRCRLAGTSARKIHCHIGHHTTNNNVEEKGGGGLMVVIDVQP